MIRTLIIGAVAAMMMGCVTNPNSSYVGRMTQDTYIKSLPLREGTQKLCHDIHYFVRKSMDSRIPFVLEEMRRRRVFTEQEVELIGDQKVAIGMSTEALYCSWGLPSGHLHMNHSASSGGTRNQYVYRPGGNSFWEAWNVGMGYAYLFNRIHVYAESGVVTGWQE